MLRLKLDYYEEKPDERGYMGEMNRSDILEVTVADATEAETLINILREVLRPEISVKPEASKQTAGYGPRDTHAQGDEA